MNKIPLKLKSTLVMGLHTLVANQTQNPILNFLHLPQSGLREIQDVKSGLCSLLSNGFNGGDGVVLV
jgi:hypothetical protein